jgi:hypothetical protein
MSTLTDIGKFRKTLDDMLIQIKKWLTKKQSMAIEKLELKLSTGMKIDPRGSIVLFLDSIEPYAHHIMSDNDQFFLENNIEIESEFIEFHDQILLWWPELDEDKQEYIRKRIKLLLMLATIALKNESLREIINKYRDPENPLIF